MCRVYVHGISVAEKIRNRRNNFNTKQGIAGKCLCVLKCVANAIERQTEMCQD